MGARVAMINHLEAAYPAIATDHIPAIFDDEYYRSPVELGWARTVNLRVPEWSLASM